VLVIGVVGGIGAGKTEVLRLLAGLGAATVAADELNREALAPGQPVLDKVRQAFGDQYFDDQGQLRRRELGDLIFHGEAARVRLERIVHPVMLELLRRRLEVWRTSGAKAGAVEAAVLARMGALGLVDRVLLVTAPERARGERLAARDGLGARETQERLTAHRRLGLDEPPADDVIVNDGDLQDLARKVEQFWVRVVQEK
jgi:dephospho-CoA kinase